MLIEMRAETGRDNGQKLSPATILATIAAGKESAGTLGVEQLKQLKDISKLAQRSAREMSSEFAGPSGVIEKSTRSAFMDAMRGAGNRLWHMMPGFGSPTSIEDDDK